MEKLVLLVFLVLHANADKPTPKYLKEYIYVERNLSWHDARTYCKNHYNELFRISDGNNLKDLSGSAAQLSWIGLVRWAMFWKWVDDSKAFYMNWYRAENCAATTKTGLWFDMPCDSIKSYVCQSASGVYNYNTRVLTWYVANSRCITYFNNFAIIRHESDNNNVSSVIPSVSAWIGLFKVTGDTPFRDTWRWVNNQPLTYSNWFTPLFCAVMDQRGFWYDRVCFEKHPFVCFGKTSNVPEYIVVQENKTWHKAKSHCQMLNMTLIMVKSLEENAALLGNISGLSVDTLYLWIGLHNNPWYWSDLGSSGIRNWNSMEPDGKDFWNNTLPNNIQSCVASMNGEWYDEDCSTALPFFCSVTVRSVILVSELKSWEEALTHCRDRYVDLASVTSDVEQQVAVRKVREVQSGYVWTGLRFLAGSWFWVYGDSLDYENWLNGGWQQCEETHRCGALAVASGKWEARSCDERLNFLCFQDE